MRAGDIGRLDDCTRCPGRRNFGVVRGKSLGHCQNVRSAPRQPSVQRPGNSGKSVMVKEKLSDVLSEFARTMVTDFPIQRILDHLVERIVDVMPISGAGVTLIFASLDPQYLPRRILRLCATRSCRPSLARDHVWLPTTLARRSPSRTSTTSCVSRGSRLAL
jgi:hypothetical protein